VPERARVQPESVQAACPVTAEHTRPHLHRLEGRGGILAAESRLVSSLQPGSPVDSFLPFSRQLPPSNVALFTRTSTISSPRSFFTLRSLLSSDGENVSSHAGQLSAETDSSTWVSPGKSVHVMPRPLLRIL